MGEELLLEEFYFVVESSILLFYSDDKQGKAILATIQQCFKTGGKAALWGTVHRY